MPIPRFYQKIALREGEVTLTFESAHYLANVRRMYEGDSLILFNGEGGEAKAEIVGLKKDRLTVKISSYQDVSRESPLDIELVQGVARGEKMDLIVQKAVELGVKKITPVLMERSTVKLEQDKREKKREHWQAVAVSACEQSGRNVVPPIALPVSFAEWLREFSGKGIMLSPYSEMKMSELEVAKGEKLTLVVGPEGGLSEQEVEYCLKKKFLSLNLGPRILRTETAPLAVMAVLQAKFGDLG